jgi:F-type H+-transporting ATPase subunit a
VFTIFGLPITETVVSTWLVMAILLGLALVLRRRLELYPDKAQNVVEIVVDGFNSLVSSNMGDNRRGFMPYMASLFLFISFANLSGLIGLRPPTSDINVTAGLALLTFLAIHYYGLKAKGWQHITGLAEPFFLFIPMNVISELAKPLSLAMRLFGNIFGGTMIMAMIAGAISIFVPILPSLYFDLFAGLLQSFIFTMITMVFITLALD